MTEEREFMDPGVCRITYGGKTMGIVFLASDMAIWGLQRTMDLRPDVSFVCVSDNGISQLHAKTREIKLRFNWKYVPGVHWNPQIASSLHTVVQSRENLLQYVFGAYFRIDDDPEGYRLVPLFEKIYDLEFGEGPEP